MVEFQQAAPTHISPASLTSSRMDRIFTTTPGWILTSVRTTAYLHPQPRELHDGGALGYARLQQRGAAIGVDSVHVDAARRELRLHRREVGRDAIGTLHHVLLDKGAEGESEPLLVLGVQAAWPSLLLTVRYRTLLAFTTHAKRHHKTYRRLAQYVLK